MVGLHKAAGIGEKLSRIVVSLSDVLRIATMSDFVDIHTGIECRSYWQRKARWQTLVDGQGVRWTRVTSQPRSV